MTIYEQIQEERIYQQRRFPVSEDDLLTPLDWYSLICDYNHWARHKASMGELGEARRRYVQVAALAIAAAEAMQRRIDV